MARIAWRSLGAVSALFALVLVVAANRYGYHRDELYFIAIGGHPAFGYVDQPPLVPLLAHAIDAVSGHSLVWLRVPSALAGALVVLVTGLIAAEFGAGRRAQVVAAAAMAVSGILLGASHLMSTTPFDLLAWTVVLWLIVRALRDDGPVWLLVGLVAGVSTEIKTLPAFLFAALLIGVLAAGPRAALTSRWLWGGAAIAVALWLPNLIWQASHGWPQAELASAIASGESGTSEPRALFLPEQLLLIGPLLAPIWIAGLWRLTRLPPWRCMPVAYAVLSVFFIVTGAKPYYLCGLYPVLLAAGAEPVLDWRRSRLLVPIAMAVSAATALVITLPIVPAASLHKTPIVEMNYDAGEQVGWPRFVATVASAYDRFHADAVLTGNYGEAGAVLRYRHDIPTYSGHNSMWDRGRPPSDARVVVAVGYSLTGLREWFSQVSQVSTIDNGLGLDNDEQGEPVWLCVGPRSPWPTLWPKLRHLD